MRISIGLLLSCVLLLSGCTAPGSTGESSKSGTSAKKKKKKKRKKKKKTNARVPANAGPTVLFTVKNAGLRSTVLPKFEEQIGVRIYWRGAERTLSLRLTRPTPWKDALDLVCQFTKTHPTTDYQGRLVLKDGWGGSLGDDVTLEELSGGTKKSKGSGATASGGSSASGGTSSSSSSSGQGKPAVTYTKGTKPGEIFGKINRVH